MTSDLTVREYREGDRETVLAVNEAAFRASGMAYVEGSPVDEELRDVTAAYLDGGGTFLVGTVEDDVVATGGFRAESERVAVMGHVRVHPDHQRRGHRGRLIAAVESCAGADGFETMVLDTHEDLTAARELYESNGYEGRRREPHPITGDEMIRYAKEL